MVITVLMLQMINLLLLSRMVICFQSMTVHVSAFIWESCWVYHPQNKFLTFQVIPSTNRSRYVLALYSDMCMTDNLEEFTKFLLLAESCEPENELVIVDMLRYCLEHADRNLPRKISAKTKVKSFMENLAV